MQAGEVQIKLMADISNIIQQMQAAERIVKMTSTGMEHAFESLRSTAIGIGASIAAGLSINAFKSLLDGSIKAAAGLHDLAIVGSTTVEALSGLAGIGKYTDTGADAIVASMNKLTKNLTSATEESAGTGKAIQALGLDMRQFASLKPDEQMVAVAKAMDGFQDGAGKSAIAMALYGKEGAKLLPFMKDLAIAQELAAKFTTEQSNAADNLDDNLKRINASSDAWKKTLVMGMVPALDEAAQAYLDVMNGTGGLRDEVKKLAADGSIAEWTRGAIIGMTYLADMVTVVYRGLKTMANGFFVYVEAAQQALSGNFSGAAKTIQSLGDDLSAMWSEETLGQRLRGRLEELKAIEKAAEAAKPKLDTDGLGRSSKAVKETVDEYAKIIAQIKEKTAMSQAELTQDKALTEAQKLEIKIMQQLTGGKLSLAEATARGIPKMIAEMIAAEQLSEAHKTLIKGDKDAEEAHTKYLQSLDAGVLKLQDEVTRQRQHNAEIGLSKTAVANLTAARDEERANLIELQAIKQLDRNGDEVTYTLLMREAAAIRELSALKQSGAVKETAVEEAKKADAAWTKFYDSLYNGLTDSLYRAFEKGQGFFKTLWDGIKNLFKTTVLKLVIQGVVGGTLGAVGVNAGATGLGNAATNAATNAALSSVGNSAWTSMTGQAGFTAQGAWTAATEAMGLTGAGSASTIAAAEAASQAAIAAGATAAEAAAAAGTAAATTTAAGAGVTTALAAIPVWGWVALAALAVFALASGDDKPSLEGGYASAGGPVGSANGRDFVGGAYGGLLDSSAKRIVDDLQTSYSATVRALGGKVGDLTAQSFVGINQGDSGSPNALHLDAQLNGNWLYNRWTDNGSSLAAGTTDAEMQAAVDLSTKKIILEALRATDLAPALNEYLDGVTTTGKTLAEITATMADVSNIAAFGRTVASLPFEYLTQASAAASLALIKSAGSFDNFSSLLGNYVSLFYSESEKTSFATKALSANFGALGISMPVIDKATRDWYKAQVALAGAQDLSIKANADQYNSLLGLASAVDALAPAADAAAAVIEASSASLRATVLDNLKSTTGSIAGILKSGMLGQISRDDVGGQVADAIANGLQDAMAQTVADQIATSFTSTIITPIIDAVLKGAAISSAVSQATIDGAVASAKQSMDAIAALFNDAGFQSLLGSIRTSLGGSTSASINSGAAQGNNGANFGGSATVGTATATAVAALTYAQQHAAIEAANAFARANPIAATGSAGQVVYREQQAFHLSAEDAASQLQSLQTALESLSASTQTEAERRAAERYVVDDSNLALYDRVQILRDEAAATALATTALSTRQSWQDKLDVLTGKTTDVALQQARELAAVEAHAAEARAQLVYVTDAAARAALEQSIATDEATKSIIGQVYAQQAATAAAAEAAAAAKAAEQAAAATAAAATAALQAAQREAASATDAALAGVQRAVEAQRTVAQAQLQVAQESVNNLTSVFDTLKTSVADLYGRVSSTASMSAISARTMIESALTTGYLPTKGELSDALSAINKGIQGTAYASQFAADRDRLVLAGKLDKLKDISGDQLTAAEQAAKNAQAQIDALDAVLKSAQAQVDAIRGVDTSVKSVEAAIAALTAAIRGEKGVTSNVAGGAGGGTSAAAGGGFANLADAQAALLKQAATQYATDNFANTTDAVVAALSAGNTSSIFVTANQALMTLASTTDAALTASGLVSKYLTLATDSALAMTDRTAYAFGEISATDLLSKYNIPGYAVGTPYVPTDGLAYLHQGEAVIPAAYNPFNGGATGSGDTSRLEALVQGLTDEVVRLRAQVDEGNKHAKRTANGVNGQQEAPIRTKAVA